MNLIGIQSVKVENWHTKSFLLLQSQIVIYDI